MKNYFTSTRGDVLAAIIFGRAHIAYKIQDEANPTQADQLFQRLNEKTEDELTRCNFSKEEVEEGLKRVLDTCGVIF